MPYLDPGDVFEKITRRTEFEVTEQHLALLRRANVRWEWVEFGAPGIDGKRPYGNSSVEADIAEILNEPGWVDAVAEDERHGHDGIAVGKWLDENNERIITLHAETGIVLQIALQTGVFKAGRYVRLGWTWRLDEPPTGEVA